MAKFKQNIIRRKKCWLLIISTHKILGYSFTSESKKKSTDAPGVGNIGSIQSNHGNVEIYTVYIYIVYIYSIYIVYI